MATTQGSSRNLGRLSEIAQVAARHGFGYVVRRNRKGDLDPDANGDAATSSDRGRRLRMMLDELGLTYPQYLVMMLLWESDHQTVGQFAGADRFAYYGYSWLALAGLQLAIRSDRVAALAMGGYPPLDGPYAEMLRVTAATHELAVANAASPPSPAEPSGQSPEETDWSQVQVTLSEGQTRQFVTLYQALWDFDDRAAQAQLTCPRLCFVGSADEIDYDERWGGVRVSLADPVIRRRDELEALGWQVEVLEGLDHMQAMQAAQVLPILRPWLLASAPTSSPPR
jgi:hypothetical protein